MAAKMHSALAVVGILMALLSTEIAGAKDGQILPHVFESTSRCHTIPYYMTVQKNGCFKRKVDTNICAGSCLSVFIPQHGSTAMQTCSVCQPTSQKTIVVSLICMKHSKFYKVNEKISVVQSCGCNIKPRPCKRI